MEEKEKIPVQTGRELNKRGKNISRMYQFIRSGYTFYKNNPLDLAALITSIISVAVSSLGLIIVLIHRSSS